MSSNPLLSDSQSKPATLGFFNQHRAQRRFLQLAGVDQLIDLADWKQALGLSNLLVTKRLFQLVDTDESGFIDVAEYCHFVACLLDTKSDRRFRLVFAIYDLDDDGQLTRDDIRLILETSLEEQSLQVSDSNLDALASGFLRHFKWDEKRTLSLDEFIAGIRQYTKFDRLLAYFTHLFLPNPALNADRKNQLVASWSVRNARQLAAQWPLYFWAALYLLANELLFLNALNQYADANTAVQLARGFGACLNFNMALILLPMCRALWSGLRHSAYFRWVPVDALTGIHRVVGWAIVLFSLLHTVAHTANYWDSATPVLQRAHAIPLFTGVVSLYLLLVMTLGLAARSGRQRERFSGTHLLYGALIAMVLLHGPHYWMWLLLPALLYFGDALYRAVFKTRRVKVMALQALSDGVTLVRFAKPRHFDFYPGDYLRVKLKELSGWEWHPFTISAAPEADYFDIHVRSNGNWSAALHNLSCKRGTDPSTLHAAIDGPYGTPTSSIYRAPVAVIVAAGIGMTPFASALESLVMSRNTGAETGVNNAAAASVIEDNQTLYFHWLNRSQRSYEWFQALLLQAESKLGDKFHLHIHLTSFSHHLTNIAMQIAVEEYYQTHRQDPFTSLQAVTNPGRPYWPALLAEIAQKHPHSPIHVYFCGPTELAKNLKHHCLNMGFFFHQEKFD